MNEENTTPTTCDNCGKAMTMDWYCEACGSGPYCGECGCPWCGDEEEQR